MLRVGYKFVYLIFDRRCVLRHILPNSLNRHYPGKEEQFSSTALDGLDNLCSKLKAQGRNLNQIIMPANMGWLTILRGDNLVQDHTKLCNAVSALVQKVR